MRCRDSRVKMYSLDCEIWIISYDIPVNLGFLLVDAVLETYNVEQCGECKPRDIQ